MNSHNYSNVKFLDKIDHLEKCTHAGQIMEIRGQCQLFVSWAWLIEHS